MISPTEIVAILSVTGSLVGSFGGILIANKLVNYRLEQLEKKVGVHNNFEGRLNAIDARCAEQQLKCKACFSEEEHKLEDHVLIYHPTQTPLR